MLSDVNPTTHSSANAQFQLTSGWGICACRLPDETANTTKTEMLASLVSIAPQFALAWLAARMIVILSKNLGIVTNLAKSPDIEQRELAAESLVELFEDDPATVTDWLQRLMQSPSAEAQRTGLKAASYIGPGARDIFLWAATKSSPDLRRATKDSSISPLAHSTRFVYSR